MEMIGHFADDHHFESVLFSNRSFYSMFYGSFFYYTFYRRPFSAPLFIFNRLQAFAEQDLSVASPSNLSTIIVCGAF